MSRATFDHLAAHPMAVLLMDRANLVRALEWNDPNGDYREPRGRPGYMTIDALRIALLAQVINSID